MRYRNSESASASCYSPLAGVSERRLEEFRLVTLLPGQFTDRIRCQLTSHPLHDPPAYETISYAWGDAKDTKTIDVDGVELTIPSSLELCLQQLRTRLDDPELPVQALWTDAICIDQTNLEERAIQVENMGTIYQRCFSMNIWLGPTNASFGDRNPFEMILHWFHDKHFYDLPGFSRPKDTEEWVFHDNPTYQAMHSLFTDGLSRSWWQRLWCIQEVAMCPKAIVRMGRWCIPWSICLQSNEKYVRHGWECCNGISKSMPARYTYFPDNMLSLPKSELTDIDNIIRALRHKLCKDPRDKIYGLLALLGKSASSLGIRPDYNMTVGDLYRQVTQVVVAQSQGDLRFLTGSGLGSDCYELASWVRNFAAPLQPDRALIEGGRSTVYASYHASGDTQSESKILNGDTLSLSGTYIDHIDRIGPVIEAQNVFDAQCIIPGVQAWAEIAGVSILINDPTPGSPHEQFWRTIVADAHIDKQGSCARFPTSSRNALSSWFTAFKNSIEHGQEPLMTPYVFAFWSSMSGRAFFRTSQGYMGMCYPHTRPGDEVWVLAGGNVPFVVRTLDHVVNASEPPARTRKLIGECYLDGFMDGEALQREGDVLVPIHLK